MIGPLTIAFGTSLFLFVSWSFLTGRERVAGRRLFLARFRGWLDAVAARVERSVALVADYIGRRVIKFTWYYSLHSFFRGLRALLERLYYYVEHRMRLHHHQARAARSANNSPSTSSHLSEMAEHKQATALTEAEKKKRKEDSLGV